MNVRVGLGFDAHQLAPDRKLFLGGVEIPHSRGLVGHSDGDVLLHAVTDALLGAAGAPDMGSLFPSGNERFRGAASRLFVAEALRILEEKGFRIIQIDTVIVAEEPPLAPHYEAIRNGLADLLGISAEAVGVKAKTTDGMGCTGRGEGIFAQAVALVEKQG
jgi:2-C-methyl-D-erythritol 2,4-cyclodiphosphate synthase